MTCYINDTGNLSWDALMPYILPYALGVPDTLISHHARLATIELCKFSGILHDKNVIDLQKGVRDYFLTTICDYQIVRVYLVSMLGRWNVTPTIRPPLRSTSAPFSGGYNGTVWSCGPYGFYMENVDVINLTNDVQQDYPKGLTVEFIVMPKQDGCTLDNYLYENYAEGIAAGALSKLLLMKNTSWFDPQLSMTFARTFQKAKTSARAAVDRNFTMGPLMMKGERWV